MSTAILNISKYDKEILQNCLERNVIKLTPFNKEKLAMELNNALVMEEEKLPDDVVRLNSKVLLLEISRKKEFNFQLVKPAEANPVKNKISMLAPISIAILGYREGDLVDWEMPGGIKKYKIVNVDNK